MKVKYTGTALPKYTNQVLEVKKFVNAGVILYLPKEDRNHVAIENGGVWKSDSLLCSLNEIESLEAEK